ncbi:MAG: zinc ABC transporter substrate-binding protein [Candidatus Aenigmarchaeota archaeon]|nr:zinc ABC transporter substrate-binding protein [Candidatus Aenigmarchaeota archaeon]
MYTGSMGGLKLAVLAAAILVAAAALITVSSQNGAKPNERPKVIASFFPLYDFARNVAGGQADVAVLVPVGAEPHDWEPTIRQVQELQSADLFIYSGAGIDPWAAKVAAKAKVKTSAGVQLIRDGEAQPDAHTWLDPLRAKQEVEQIRDGMVAMDPPHAQVYASNAATYLAKLDALHADTSAMLANCRTRDFISFHQAFGYFALRYNLTQHSLLGTDPEGEILPQALQQAIALARQYNISVVYAEDLLDPRLAQTVAASIPNGQVEVLSPVEGLTAEQQAAGMGYIDKMQINLAKLAGGLGCA